MNAIKGFFSNTCCSCCCSNQKEDPITEYEKTVKMQNMFQQKMDELGAQIPDERRRELNEKLQENLKNVIGKEKQT